MTEEQFSVLSREKKATLLHLFIADIAERLLSEDEATVQTARHELGNLAMVFMNMNYLVTSEADNRAMIESIYQEYRSHAAPDAPTG